MTTPLDPLISEFATVEEAESYDRWFRAKIEKSMADTRPGIPHDEVMAEMDAIIDEAEKRKRPFLTTRRWQAFAPNSKPEFGIPND